MHNELDTTRELLSRQLFTAIATDAIGVLPIITALQKQTDEQLREAVRRAAQSSSWSEIAGALGVSKQAAHQRFRTYAEDVAVEIKAHRRAVKHARRSGDVAQAAAERARAKELAAQLRAAGRALRDHR